MADLGGGMADLDKLLTAGINNLILWALAFSGLIAVLEVVGFLPGWLSRWINRNRLSETMRLLKQFGVDVDTPRRANSVARLEKIAGKDLAARVTGRTEEAKIRHAVSVGTQIVLPGDHFIDLMGATSDLNVAEMYARDLTALWRQLADIGGPIANNDIEFVVTPKTGSPLLGAAFAKALGKPLLLHNPEPKFRSDPLDPKAFFDCREVPKAGARGLIVDDSSTGGGKAAKLIDDVARFGWELSDFLVVFEPQLKVSTGQNAAERLKPKGVTLHSIIKT